LIEASMAKTSGRSALVLTPQQRASLEELAASRTAAASEVERAKVLLGYAAGTSVTELQRQFGFSRPMIYRCVDKALAAGVQMRLKDKVHRPHRPEISEEAKAWVISIACTKPKDHELAAELWTISALARFVSEGAESAGFPRLANAARSGASSTRTRSSRTSSAATWRGWTRSSIARCRKS
jgi:transposase